MQVRHALASVRTIVNDHAITAGEVQFAGNLARRQEQVAQNCLIYFRRISQERNDYLRDDQDMNRCLWINIVKSKGLVVFPHYFRWDFTRDDLFKNRHGKLRGFGLSQFTPKAGIPLF